MSKADWDKVAHKTHEQTQQRATPLAYTIKDAVKLTGMSRTRLYEELKSGRLVAKKAGRATLIPHESLEAWLKNLDNYPGAMPFSNESKFTP